jgi:hypothetical protein
LRRDLGDGYELDDDPGRIDRGAVHRYLYRKFGFSEPGDRALERWSRAS